MRKATTAGPMAAILKQLQPLQPWEARRVRHHTPLKLQRLLKQLGTSQAEMSRAMKLSSGDQPDTSTVCQIVVRDLWPARTPRAELVAQIVAFLRSKGATDTEIETAFEIDDDAGKVVPITRQSTGRTRRVAAPLEYENQLPENCMLSQNAKKHFSLFRDPFIDDVQSADDVFLSSDQRYIRETMYHTAKHGGFIAVVGESGAGKTTLRRDLLDRIQREGAQITVIQPRIIDKGKLTAGAICDAIINDVSKDRPKHSLEGKARQIEKLLIGSNRAGNSHVLIIEEAHDLGIATLKYLKRFYEIEDGFKKLISIILVGQPELKDKLDERQNWDAREVIRRIEVAELQPLNGNLEEYIGMKLKRISRKLDDLFEKSAFDAIRSRLVIRRRGDDHGISMMYPLVVNNTVTKALNLAAEIGAPRITAEIIKEI